MSKDIGTLSARITATTSGLDAALKSADSKFKAFASSIESRLAMVGLAKGGVLALADVVRGPIEAIQHQMEALDKTGKLSDRLGIASENLIGLQHASELAGVSGEELETALTMLSRKLGEATSGSAEANKAFEQLGLSADDLSKMDLGRAF